MCMSEEGRGGGGGENCVSWVWGGRSLDKYFYYHCHLWHNLYAKSGGEQPYT